MNVEEARVGTGLGAVCSRLVLEFAIAKASLEILTLTNAMYSKGVCVTGSIEPVPNMQLQVCQVQSPAISKDFVKYPA